MGKDTLGGVLSDWQGAMIPLDRHDSCMASWFHLSSKSLPGKVCAQVQTVIARVVQHRVAPSFNRTHEVHFYFTLTLICDSLVM